jgi:hypothetical protein
VALEAAAVLVGIWAALVTRARQPEIILVLYLLYKVLRVLAGMAGAMVDKAQQHGLAHPLAAIFHYGQEVAYPVAVGLAL